MFQHETEKVLPPEFPWLREQPSTRASSEDDRAANLFIDKYVLLPCNESSSPGFLEHLPSLFKEVNVEGHYALRFAVQACAFADLSREQRSEDLVRRSLECYGNALTALGQSLAERHKIPDDYDLMTTVMLDIFETLFMPDAATNGSHAQGMAHILRLRGHGQFHDPRGWSLFRLAHHRLQKQQLAKQLSPLPESHNWLEALNDNMASIKLEKYTLAISKICQQANQVILSLDVDSLDTGRSLDLVDEMRRLDHEATLWRKKPEWEFRVMSSSDITGSKRSDLWLPETIQLHPDLWMAYEWNYHRTARIILHQKLIGCLERVTCASQNEALKSRITDSTGIIQSLAREILSTVPQSLGDINYMGRYHLGSKPARWQAVGAYLLLWPIKVIKSSDTSTTTEQKEDAQRVFGRIRECTGMESRLGVLSDI
ncbi:hypothetical protein FGRMN_9186 [Fusarium graminum]|nr:hypothetical protein FGRMN_9186 [Fusarium graminum]